MKIQCECGKVAIELTAFPKNTPGRLKCYCDDCQSYLHHLQRADLLDQNGGTEIIPMYPADVKIISGKEFLKCTRLSDKGMYRFSTTCCNTPIANTDTTRPWAGFHRRMFAAKPPNSLDQTFKSVKSSIMGKYAKGTPPPGTPQKFDLNGMVTVLPFLLKGVVMGKAKGSPFFDEKGAAIAKPTVLTPEQLKSVRAQAGLEPR